MKNIIIKVLIFITILSIIANFFTINFLEYEFFIRMLLIIVLVIDIFFCMYINIQLRYLLLRGKKAIIYADVSNSKLIKLYYGNDISNKIFNDIYDVIEKCVKRGCVKRKFKSHYAILIKYDNKHEIIDLVNKINNEIHKINYNDLVHLTIKFGIQLCDDESYEENENKAELACNLAKNNLLNIYRFYSESDGESQIEEKKMLNILIKALKNNEFEVYFQPKFDNKLNKIVGSEALVRLKQNGKIIPAKDFIDIAEKYAFTVPLDKYVLKEVCKKIKELKKKKLTFNTISINVSRSTISEENMIEYYMKTLEEYDIKRGDIELEITERDSNSSGDLTNVVHELCKKFNVSIDDFGIGNSSLSMLSENKIKTIKIDRKFVIDESESGRKILNNIIKLSKDLGFEIIAEGVETKEQQDYLKSKGCSVVQGYYYSKPLSFEDYENMLKK